MNKRQAFWANTISIAIALALGLIPMHVLIRKAGSSWADFNAAFPLMFPLVIIYLVFQFAFMAKFDRLPFRGFDDIPAEPPAR